VRQDFVISGYKRLVRTALKQFACVAKPDTILAWYRKLIARLIVSNVPPLRIIS
jgi:hypothetical protein